MLASVVVSSHSMTGLPCAPSDSVLNCRYHVRWLCQNPDHVTDCPSYPDGVIRGTIDSTCVSHDLRMILGPVSPQSPLTCPTLPSRRYPCASRTRGSVCALKMANLGGLRNLLCLHFWFKQTAGREGPGRMLTRRVLHSMMRNNPTSRACVVWCAS